MGHIYKIVAFLLKDQLINNSINVCEYSSVNCGHETSVISRSDESKQTRKHNNPRHTETMTSFELVNIDT